jgi:methyl-galactoside transport system substrate-binding protein
MALGAIDYFLEENIFTIHDSEYDQPLVIIGVDGTQVGLNAIEQGLMYGSVLNDAKKQSQVIVDLVEYLKDEKDMSTFPYNIEKQHFIYVDGEAILKAN